MSSETFSGSGLNTFGLVWVLGVVLVGFGVRFGVGLGGDLGYVWRGSLM